MSNLPAATQNSTQTAAGGPGAAAYIDPGTLMRIKNLELRARVVVEGFLTGLHRSPYHGFSVEFTEYRQYTPGDDPRYLDWRLFARTDRYYIKCFEDETNLRCYLLVDLSRSMAYGSAGYDKAEYAKTAAATIAYYLSLQRDAVGLTTFDETIVDSLPARFRPGHVHRLMLALERSPGGKATDIDRPLEQIAATVRKRGMIVLISDLLTKIDTLKTNLGYLRSRGHEVLLIRVLDPTEMTFEFDEPAMFHDVESGRDLYVDPETVRESYLRQFNEHAEEIKTICTSLGVEYLPVTIDTPLELILFEFLNARMQRGRAVTRQRAAPRGGAG